jgi:acyl-CoA reductase-like NAD-dependent aldehyde dehydrogenase
MSTTDSFARADAGLDEALVALRRGGDAWSNRSHAQRAKLLRSLHAAIVPEARAWADAAARAKGLSPDENLAGEEWVSGPYITLATVATYVRDYRQFARGRSTSDGLRFRHVPGNRVAARILPENLRERTLFNGFSGEVWFQPGVSEERVRSRAGLGAREPGVNGGVALVLGAGNISAIGPLDVLYELVAHNRTSILKLNPTFESLLAVLLRAFAPLVDADVVRIVNGGADVGSYLAQHAHINKVRITGSKATHDLIVWGSGEEANRRRAAKDPKLTTPITSELGGVAPVIVVPGRWSKADLQFQARHVVTMRLHNASHNCIAAQEIIVPTSWSQKDEFLAAVRRELGEVAPRAPWYPGSDAKLAAARRSHPEVEDIAGRLLTRADVGDELLSEEYFVPVLGYTEIAGSGAEYLDAAIDFANDSIFGTLGANIIIKPSDRAAMGTGFDTALSRLLYGSIGVNAWSAAAFLLPNATWGGFPGHTIEDVGSGIGVVHNGHLFDDAERSVITGPFAPFPRALPSLFPTPPWFVQSRSVLATSQRLTDYAAKPGWRRLVPVLFAAYRA